MRVSIFKHGLSLGVAAGFFVLALGSKQDPKAKAEAEKAAKEAAKGLDDYFTHMAAAYANMSKLDLGAIESKPCDGPAMLKAATADDETHTLRLRYAYGPFLSRFGKDKSAWNAGEGDWKFLTESTWRGHFEEHPDDRQAYGIQDTAQRVQETFMAERYLVVAWPEDLKENKLPVWKENDPYEGGFFLGWAFVIDQKDGSIACQYPLEVESSREISFRTGGRRLGKLLDQKPETVLKDDFEDNLEAALEKGLPEGIELTGGLGRILK